MTVLNSVTTTALTSALDALAARQKVTANNIANVNTPGYTAQRVSFEQELAKSINAGSGTSSYATTSSTATADENGNNVHLDAETLSNIDTVLRYQFATQAVGWEFSNVRAALKTA